MAGSKSNAQNESYKNFVEMLQIDFKNLAQDTRKKYPQIKESCEEAISKLEDSSSNQHTSIYYMVNQILYPLVQGCETKDLKVIKFCLGMMQRLITQQVVDQKGAIYITDALWMLMESNIEEVKILQTVTLLLTTNSVVHGDTLAKSLVLCFRLHYSKDSITANIAGATIRQLVSLVFERLLQVQMITKDLKNVNDQSDEHSSNVQSEHLEVDCCISDAYLLFQDLILLVNADQPLWLCGMTEMTRTFGLELIEVTLKNFSKIYCEIPRFTQLLKEQVCALVIKLFSPNIKIRPIAPPGLMMGNTPDKPHFSLSMRLLRVVSVLIQKFHNILVTECEIFLSLIIKFLDIDKPNWQRALALEVIHQIVTKPNLICFLCMSYDLKDHATKIFQDIVNSLGMYVCNLLKTPTNQNGQNPNNPIAHNASPTLPSASGFLLNGNNAHNLIIFTPGNSKATYLEMLDKMEPPNIPDGYGMALAYAILLDITRSVSLILESSQNKQQFQEDNKMNQDKILHCQLIKSSWSGMLSALICLLDATTDDAIVATILNAMQEYAALCGTLNLLNPRDAFITAICRASFPPHYTVSILNSGQRDNEFKCSYKLLANHEVGHSYANCNENEIRQHENSFLPITMLTVNIPQGPVMLNSKNLQCMKAILNLAYCRGSILGTSWYIVLATLQHLVCIIGLKPSTGGSLQITAKTETNAGIQTAVMVDLPILSQMLSQLFESSKNLDDVALHHLVDALCKLSQEAMELAYSNREPSLFAVAKLLEIGLVNMFRVEILWRPLTNHLLEVCQHRHIRMREWGVEAITYLVKVALQFKYDKPLKENMELQTMLLNPFSQLSTVPHGDVRQRQLECVLQILNSSGEIFSFGWPALIEIIGAVSDHHGEPLIRTAFQCLQLVITDFLPIMPWNCLPMCINTASKFGSQNQELNISLTAIGLMWNISDYFNQNQNKLMQTDVEDLIMLPHFPGIVNLPQFDKLWMCLYARMGDLCVDLRPAVRKSAGQTLFSTISAHGSLLGPQTWQALVWHVMFPLLDKVRSFSSSASNEKVDTSGNILIHHSRNTAQKQWAETHVLILSGVSRVFNSQKNLLQLLGDFPRAWTLILEFIQNAALNKIDEVSLAALKSFQEIMFQNYEKKNVFSTSDNKINLDSQIWMEAWRVWLNIGLETIAFVEEIDDLVEDLYIPNQAFLTALVQIFPAIFQHIRTEFSLEDFEQLCNVLTNIIEIPYQSDSVPYLMSSLSDSLLTPLHDTILDCLELIQKEATKEESQLTVIIPHIFKQLLSFSKLACVLPSCKGIQARLKKNHTVCSTIEFSSNNYVPFGEKALTLSVKLYQMTSKHEIVIKNHILQEIIQTLKKPLSLKYNCISASTWKLAISSLFKVLQLGLKVARIESIYFVDMWDVLAETLDQFLFPTSVCTAEDRGLEEIVLDESIDCQVIEMLKEEILPFASEIPHKFIIKIVVLLNKGSIHSAAETSVCCDSDWKLRELFAKTCFETLLQFSLLDDLSNNNNFKDNSEKEYFAGRLAVTALLHRFQEVLKKFTDDERHSGKCPLPRYRLSEIAFVLKAIETLILSMKKTSSNKVNKNAWTQIIALFPFLVDCTTTTSTEVSRALRDTLLQYTDLLQTPKTQNDEESKSNKKSDNDDQQLLY